MTQLIPCPGCNRHVRQAETSCPFCSAELSLLHLPPAALPRARLGRAATFAFGATLVGATSLIACGGESEEGKKEGSGGGGSAAGGTTSKAGEASGGSSAGTGVVGPVYGAPAAGSGNEGGFGNSAGMSSAGTSGGPAPLYGAPAAGSGNFGGNPGVPVYGAAPAD